jgi:hypothetical protein
METPERANRTFTLSDDQLKDYSLKLLEFGKAEKLHPCELAIILGMVKDRIMTVTDMRNIEITEVQGPLN